MLVGRNPNSLANLKQNQPKEPTTEPTRKQSDEDFIDKMQRYEKLRQDIYNTEQQKRNSILAELQDQIGDDDYEEDDGQEALSMFQNFMQLYQNQNTATPTAGTGQSIAQSSNTNLSDNDIANVINAVQQEHPKLIKRVRNGSITKEQAISFLKLRGVSEVDATRIYEKAMNDGR